MTEKQPPKAEKQPVHPQSQDYQDMLMNAPVGVYISTPGGRFIYVNAAQARMFGYDSPRDMRESVTDIGKQLHTDLGNREAMMRSLEENGEIRNYESSFIRKDGSVFWISYDARAVRDEKGNIIHYQGFVSDITDRKQAEEALRESEQKYRNLFENANEAIFIVHDAKIIFLNPSTNRMSGYSAEELMSKPFAAFIHPDDREMVVERHIRRLKGEILPHLYDFRILHKDGGIRWVELNAVLFDWDGKPATLNFMGDITERKQAEESLRESEDRYRTIIDEMEEGYQEVDLSGNFTFFNEAFLRIFGYSRDEMMGTNFRRYAADKEIAETVFRAYTRMYRTGIPIRHFEWDIIRKDGARRTFEFYASLLRDAHDLPIGFRGIVRDITERSQAETELQESRRRLENIIEFLPDATLVIDKEGTVIAWNRAIEVMTGVSKKDMLGKGNYEYAIPFYGERRPILIDYALDPKHEVLTQYTGVHSVGDIIVGEAHTPNLPPGDVNVYATASVLQNAQGETIAAIECIRDNTERKRMEQQLRRAEKMESLGTLAGGVAHDLNNVLGVLVGYAELLAEQLPRDSSARRYADNILQSSIRGAAIIQDLLTLARRGVSVSEVVNLNGLIVDYLRAPEFEELKYHYPHVRIVTDLAEGLLNIKGSAVHLGKTIMNLVLNAAESITGQGEVTIRTENRYLDRPISGYDEMQEGDYVVLGVSDTGSGISPDDLGRIFEPFYTKKVMGRSGTGLGLSVVWGAVKDHNGYIDAQSEGDKGSTFTLYFPVTREEPAKTEKTKSLDDYLGEGESILVVDDVKEQREVAISMLERLGYRVEAVASGEEAIEYLRNKSADLIVLDMIMDPGIDGMETYRRILEINPGQKAIIASGFSETDRVLKTQNMGAGAFIRKPYILEKIGFAVRRELDN